MNNQQRSLLLYVNVPLGQSKMKQNLNEERWPNCSVVDHVRYQMKKLYPFGSGKRRIKVKGEFMPGLRGGLQGLIKGAPQAMWECGSKWSCVSWEDLSQAHSEKYPQLREVQQECIRATGNPSWKETKSDQPESQLRECLVPGCYISSYHAGVQLQ